MIKPGDVVLADFVGANGVKQRPAVVASSAVYHLHRPDLVLGVLTTQLKSATTPLDYVLLDWAAAGLHRPSAFRAYFSMSPPAAAQPVGRLTDRDWHGVQACLAKTFGFLFPPLAAPKVVP
jgi:mRNA interferase MazF